MTRGDRRDGHARLSRLVLASLIFVAGLAASAAIVTGAEPASTG
jgi:hypothetical protein